MNIRTALGRRRNISEIAAAQPGSVPARVRRLPRLTTLTLAAVATMGGLLSAAPAAHAAPPAPAMTFTVSTSRQQVGGSVLVQAALSANISNTGYFVRLYDKSTGTILRQCAAGTYCSVFVVQKTATTHVYGAHLDRGWGGPAPYPILAAAEKPVSWVTIPATRHWTLSDLSSGNVSTQGGSLTISRDGSWQYTVSLHDSSTFYGDNYAIGFVFQGFGHGAAADGSLGAKYSGPAVNATVTIGGKDPWIAANYDRIVLADAIHTRLHTDGDFGQLAGGIWNDLKPYAGTALTWLAGTVLA